MGYRLRMSAEIREWLTELRDNNPPIGALVAQAIAALAAEGADLGPPLVTAMKEPGRTRADYLIDALDRRYQSQLEELTQLRRNVAVAASLRRDVELLLESEPSGELRDTLPSLMDAEKQLTLASQQRQRQVDEFRTRKEVLKASLTTAAATQGIAKLMAEEGEEDPEMTVADAEASIRELTGEIAAELRGYAPEEDLLRLRPRVPAGSMIQLIFAVEPAGTVLLLSVLDGNDTIRDDLPEALSLSAQVLQMVRDDENDDAIEHEYADARAFLRDIFADDADHIEAAATALIAKNRPCSLEAQRAQAHLTLLEMAEHLNVTPGRIEEIEAAPADELPVRTLARYVEALGGDLRVIADFGDTRTRIY